MAFGNRVFGPVSHAGAVAAEAGGATSIVATNAATVNAEAANFVFMSPPNELPMRADCGMGQQQLDLSVASFPLASRDGPAGQQAHS